MQGVIEYERRWEKNKTINERRIKEEEKNKD